MNSAKDVKALLISDSHLGARSARPDKLLEVLKKAEELKVEEIYIIGDFIDGWKISRNKFYWREDATRVIRKLLKFLQRGVKVFYIPGNHDDFVRKAFDTQLIPNLTIVDEHILKAGDRKYLVIHGDQFDAFTKHKYSNKWLMYLGDNLYETLIFISKKYMDWFNSEFSISKMVKSKFKDAMKYISSFEETLQDYAERNDCYGVICGHIHYPKISEDKKYINTGDFVENNSFIWMDEDGKFYLEFA